ncbi:MAG TPA: outer membrane protein assembly factor BamA [Rhodospirillaceae bacterium]|nr:outer membrane protein assembly factor BamA [Rhodospirillaceae bacterium]
MPQARAAEDIASIRVSGAQRIEDSTILSYLAVHPGEAFDAEKLDISLKALFETGMFSDVVLKREGDDLVVSLQENPVVNRIAFEGNKRIDDDELNSEIQMRPRVVFTRPRVQADTDRILDLYRRNGRFAAKVMPEVIKLDQNRVDLVFKIDEGPKTTIGRIAFIGNQAFSDSQLREEIRSRESRWYRFFSSDDTYDPDRLSFDKELLRRFYLTNGYADFRVASAVAELAPGGEEFFLTFTVEEGPRYRFGRIGIESSIPKLDAKDLEPMVNLMPGEWYDALSVDKESIKLTDALAAQQMPFVNVSPRFIRDPDAHIIDVVMEVREGSRNFVERIDISGNVRTMDKVVRREFDLAEGDALNSTKLARSEKQVNDLGFFEKVDIHVAPGSAPDQKVIDVKVAEQSTGDMSIGAGYSTTDGMLADFSIHERNLLGKGQDLSLSTTLASEKNEINISFTEPYFMDRDISAGFDIFNIMRDQQDESSYDQKQQGFGLRMSYPLSQNLRQRILYRLERNEITSVDSTASIYIREQEGSRTTSMLGHELTLDTRNSKLAPSEGYLVRMTNDLAGFGGTTHFLRNKIIGIYYYPVSPEWVFSLAGEAGLVWGIGDDVNIADRYFLGGNSLRGFATGGVGPRDTATGDSLGGNHYVSGSAELAFPLGLPSELGIKAHVFGDAGTLGSVDSTGATIVDEDALRASIGAGISWRSPMGPIRFDYASALIKEDYDEVENFRFSFGTRF